jgi:hypothetical protein
VDWVLNESHEMSYLDWLGKHIGKKTTIIQNLCGWEQHDATMWQNLNLSRVGLYGFAKADAGTTFPSQSTRPKDYANTQIVRQAYHALAQQESKS